LRLVSFTAAGTDRVRFGVREGDLVIDPDRLLRADLIARRGAAAADSFPGVATDMVAFFESGASGTGEARRAVDIALSALEGGDLPDGVHRLEAVTLKAPVPRPRRVRDYLTYQAHASGSHLPVPPAFEAMPICYKCNVESIIGPEDTLLWPSYTSQLDFELELGFFSSGGGRNLTPSEAQALIAGVTIFNDVSARDIQFFEMSMGIGPSKGKDFCTAMGPCVQTMDEVDEWAVEMSARVNGELWASGTTGRRQFSFAEILAWASFDEDVYPGEFFAVGTVGGGCGLELDRWIRPGDIVELEAVGVGVLRNPVGHPAGAPAGAGLASYQGAPAVHLGKA
jgi:2-keto-4-pentenoate hydratase/2-oxohepta-3-ene-1,7-dioic acid hydratase in catechol pathway